MNVPSELKRRAASSMNRIIFTGALPDDQEVHAPEIQRAPQVLVEVGYPDRFNWDTLGVIPDPGTQLPLMACVSYAASAVVAARVKIKTSTTVVLAPRAMHLCTLDLAPSSGTSSRLLVESALRHGFPVAGPNSNAALSRMTQKAQCPIASELARLPITGAFAFTTPEDVKREISSRGPVVAHISLYSDFGDYPGGIYSPKPPMPKGEHAVCLIGYDDLQQCWIGLNSFGTEWGERGRFRLRYGTCNLLAQYKPTYSLVV
ncbi:C1 family peptidase [Polaromonas sp. LjRoot131]|uniref:C1 family peptidase n=1 Tax=Polaromonas sp. LjRoot131 TaxID=3342262 RepID=UPI003F501D60